MINNHLLIHLLFLFLRIKLAKYLAFPKRTAYSLFERGISLRDN